jgi:hypothetical protein
MPKKIPHSPETQFKKGQSGNPNGRPKKLPAIDEILADVLGEEKDGKTAAQAILMALRAKATKGDVRAAEILMDRAYGKAKQTIEQTGPPQKIVIERELIQDSKKSIMNGNGSHKA